MEKIMAPFQTNPDATSADMVTKVGWAAGRVARIQQEYAMQAEAEAVTEARDALANKAREAAEQAIDAQGITVQDYNTVLTAAGTDPDLEERLLTAAREVL
jgi:hypothetical protein